MSYATWRKCDFQVHTPRDPNWQGERPIGLDEIIQETGVAATQADVDFARSEWANHFVDKCLEKGLQAIAITDHHELVMVPYVQREIAARVSEGNSCDLWVFPGMELTAHGGVQALIIFDADLKEEWWRQAQGKLGIVYASLDENASRSPRVTQLVCNYADIAHEIDTIQGLQGRYIVLPNVSQGNNHTVLKDGAHVDFLRMPYVGGYLDRDQSIDTLSSRNKKRLSGYDRNWSHREIYPLPTSDSRSSNYEHLGENKTWIKLSEPTAEAIRQAFLAHQSRISIEVPVIPSLWISNIEINGSEILQSTVVDLSPELNSIIGGRGSGKSSFLEYLSFGLCRSSYDVPLDQYSGTDRLSGLIKDSLLSQNGSVVIKLIQDNALFKISRDASSAHQPQITYPNGDKQPVSLSELRSLFPAVVYSQGELAEIGKKTGTKSKLSDLLQFVNPEYKREDDALLQDIDAAKNEVRSSLQSLSIGWSTQSKKHKLLTKRDSLRQRVKALEKTLPKQSEDDQAILKTFENINEFEAKRLQASKHAERMASELISLKDEFSSTKDVQTDLDGKAKDFVVAYEKFVLDFQKGISRLSSEVDVNRAALVVTESTWSDEYQTAKGSRDAVLDKLGEHRTVTTQIISLNEQIDEITNEIGDLDTEISGSPDLSSSLAGSIKKLQDSVQSRTNRTRQWAQEIETLSSEKIKAIVNEDGDIAEIYESLDIVSAKSGSQEAKRLRSVTEFVEIASIWELINRLRTDCINIFYWSKLGNTLGEEPPDINDFSSVIGDTEKIISSSFELMDVSRLEAISTAVPKPEISLFYCDGDKDISFEKASEGQRAAALLFMLLEQGGGPLIVDQPEGDLDNKIISDLTSKLHKAKSRRQIVFASHNANIVVNGASEMVAYIGIDENGNRKFEAIGAIDESVICNHITTTMEGGEKAFRDRKDKYGF